MRKWLYDMRKEAKLSQKELAQLLHISESYYCSIENGNRQKSMDITLVSKIADIFDSPVSEIASKELSSIT